MKQSIKEFLALYEEVMSYKEISYRTGYSVKELRKIYDEMFNSKELFSLKEKVNSIMYQGGIVRINPVTFEYKIYKDRSEITKDGFFVQNVIRACGMNDSVVAGYLWRYGNYIDLNNVEKCLKEEAPNLFRPVIAENKSEKAEHRFNSLIEAGLVGYDIWIIKKSLKDKTKYKNLYWRYE